MNKKYSWKYMIIACVVGTFFASCTSYHRNPSEVIVHELADPDMLNPVNSTDAGASEIMGNMFQPLLAYDYKTLKLVPVLAVSRPDIKKDSTGDLLITYEIRKQAKWDNGTPITAKDVAFSLKVIKNPKVNDEPAKPYYDFINSIKYIKIDSSDPRRFTLVCTKVYVLAESVSGGFSILPRYLYDPKGLMADFSLKQLSDSNAQLANNPKIIAFAKDFNSEKRMRDPKYIDGSGPYKFTKWLTGQRVVLTKKKNWWGDPLAGTNCFFDAYASKLIYQTINDPTTAVVSLKAGNIDAMSGIKPPDFIDLPKSKKFMEHFVTYTPMQFAYSYIGINMARPKFQDIKTRQALAHLVDVDKMIHDIMYGYGKRVIGPVSPADSMDYNYNIKPYDYDITKAKALLADDGWKDSDGDGVLDKMIDGNKVKFDIKFIINSGNDVRKKIALLFQEAARQVGIKVTVTQQDWSVYLSNLKKHDFDVYCAGWVTSPGPSDFKQIWYTTSARNGGSNAVSFGNAASDALIDSMRTELDPVKRAAMTKRFQVMLHNQVPYIFLWASEGRIAINKRFTNAYPSMIYPGFFEAGFKAKATK